MNIKHSEMNPKKYFFYDNTLIYPKLEMSFNIWIILNHF